MSIKFVKKRNWDIVEFNKNLIKNAIEKAYMEIENRDEIDLDTIVSNICEDVEIFEKKLEQQDIIGVEDIQDLVEKNLMDSEQHDVVKKYIIYRNEHKKIREEKKAEIIEKIESNQLYVIKDDWKKEKFEINKIQKTYERIAWDLLKLCPFMEIEGALRKYIVDEINTSDINKLLVKTAVNLISIENIHWQFIAGRFLTIDLYKKASRERNLELKDLYTPKAFADFVKEYVDAGWYYEDFFKYYSIN